MLAKFDDHRSDRDGDINSYIKSYTDPLKKAELASSIHHIVRFVKTGIPIYNSEVPDTADRKTRRRTQAIAKRSAFHANAKNTENLLTVLKHRCNKTTST